MLVSANHASSNPDLFVRGFIHWSNLKNAGFFLSAGLNMSPVTRLKKTVRIQITTFFSYVTGKLACYVLSGESLSGVFLLEKTNWSWLSNLQPALKKVETI